MVTQPVGNGGFEWDLGTWQHSKPAVFNGGLGIGCMQGEMSACTIQEFPMDGSSCSIRILNLGLEVGIGLCTKKHGKMNVYWRFSSLCGCAGGSSGAGVSSASKFCSSAGAPSPYGCAFGAGDIVTIRIINGDLEYSVNNRPLGTAFSGFKPSIGKVYLRVYMVSSPSIKRGLQDVLARFGSSVSMDEVAHYL